MAKQEKHRENRNKDSLLRKLESTHWRWSKWLWKKHIKSILLLYQHFRYTCLQSSYEMTWWSSHWNRVFPFEVKPWNDLRERTQLQLFEIRLVITLSYWIKDHLWNVQWISAVSQHSKHIPYSLAHSLPFTLNMYDVNRTIVTLCYLTIELVR